MIKTIYSIVCKDESVKDCYVGQTKDFKDRRWHHIGNCKNPKSKKYNFKVYQYIRHYGGFENWEMIALETFECESEDEARDKEFEYYEKLNASLNSVPPKKNKIFSIK
jgi:hypothetical protein